MQKFFEAAPLDQAIELLSLMASKLPADLEREQTPYLYCLVGLARLTIKHGRTIAWAISTKNILALMTTARVLLEINFNLVYITERPDANDYRDYRAALLLLDGLDRELRSFQAPSIFEFEKPKSTQKVIRIVENEKQQLLKAIDQMVKGPADPDRWTASRQENLKGVSVWARAKVNDILRIGYHQIYERGSGYVHSDGYAIEDMKRRHNLKNLGALCSHMITFVAFQVMDAFPDAGEAPEVVALGKLVGTHT